MATKAQYVKRMKDLRDEIEKRRGEYEKLVDSDIAQAVSYVYSEKYRGISPEGETINGKDAIASYLKAHCHDMKCKIDEVNGEGEFAYVRGTFKSSKGNGKYLAVWKREADVLHVYNECWNFSSAAA